MLIHRLFFFFFFFNDTATTEIYTLSLHDALPIWMPGATNSFLLLGWSSNLAGMDWANDANSLSNQLRGAVLTGGRRSEEHTSELQSQSNLVCRLLLEKKKIKQEKNTVQKNNTINK